MKYLCYHALICINMLYLRPFFVCMILTIGICEDVAGFLTIFLHTTTTLVLGLGGRVGR